MARYLKMSQTRKSRACDPALCVSADINWAFAIIYQSECRRRCRFLHRLGIFQP